MDWSRVCCRRVLDRRRLGGLNGLHLGAAGGSVDVLRFYIENDLLQDANAKADDDLTPLHLATFRGHLGAVRYLCSHGCDVNAHTVDGSSALHFAAKTDRLQIARFLWQAGCKPSRDAAGRMPSFYVSKKNKTLSEWFQSIDPSPEFVVHRPCTTQTDRRMRDKAFAPSCEAPSKKTVCKRLRNCGVKVAISRWP
ncbi:ankyrin repeat protein [Colletotrichum kahawae]|uniref:Ankyrin repeat protein n=1 Tax=Colletotrichum kahawae TaxID=34407 RepID=A0AAD9YDT0_COLKA|nr:ankyrin repeat protein [Colletotrichum kahawae]